MLPRPTGRHYRLAAADVRTAVASILETTLDPFAPGRIVDLPMVMDVLIYAAATRGSIHSACKALEGSADDNTVREYINELVRVENLDSLEDVVNMALAGQIPRKVRRGRWDVACDTHDQPFYGHSPELLAMTCRGEAKDGTTHFFRIATACVLADGLRLTLAIAFVRPGETLAEVLGRLLDRVKAHVAGIRCLYADKGFASIEIYRLVERQKVSAIIACPIRGTTGGSRALCRGNKSYSTNYTFNGESGSYQALVSLVRVFHTDKPYEKAIEWRMFVQINNTMTSQQIQVSYRRRFGIEASYRCLNQTRATTTTKNAALRFFLMGLALVILNTWIILRFHYGQVCRRGRLGRWIDEGRFRLRQMTSFLRSAIEEVYGLCTSIFATSPPLSYDL